MAEEIKKVVDVVSREGQAKAAADAKAKADADAKVAADAKAKAAAESGEKVGDLLKKAEERQVPESAFLDIKNENKELWAELKKTQEMVAEGLSKKEVSEKLKAIGEKYKVDPNFLNEVSDAIKAEGKQGEKVSEKKPAEDPADKNAKAQGEAERIDKIFKENFAKTLDAMPDFKGVADADPDYVKYLTLLPANANKTFAQILEENFGDKVKGKGKTFDAAQPGSRKENTEIDYDKASRDPEYFKEIMADPASRKEYNSNLHRRLKL